MFYTPYCYVQTKKKKKTTETFARGFNSGGRGGGGDSHMEGMGMLVGKRDHITIQNYFFLVNSWCAALNETSTANNNDILSRTP